MRLLPLLLLLAVCSCRDEATRLEPRLIQKEPIPSKEEGFRACSGPPVTPILTIGAKYATLDGFFIEDDSQLESMLTAKQDLTALLGDDPIHDIVVRVAARVPEARVARLLGRARSAGFVDVTRLPPFEEVHPSPRRTPKKSRRP